MNYFYHCTLYLEQIHVQKLDKIPKCCCGKNIAVVNVLPVKTGAHMANSDLLTTVKRLRATANHKFLFPSTNSHILPCQTQLQLSITH